MSITRDFKLSLVAGRSVPLVINANQYDHGEIWRFTLLDENGQKYSPSTGSIIGLKSDGHIIANAGTVSSTGLVIIPETEQMTAAVGKNFFELLIDDDTHGTANFIVFVEPRPGAGGTPSDSDLAVFQEAIDAAATIGDVVDLVDDVAVLEARMDEFTTLTDGSTTGDAELADIRVGADGTTYPNAGDAVRGQVSDLKNALNESVTDLNAYFEIFKDGVVINYHETVTVGYHVYNFAKTIAQGTKVKITNNSTTTTFSVNFRKADGTSQTMSSGIVPGQSVEVIAPFRTVDMRCYCNNTDWNFTVEYGGDINKLTDIVNDIIVRNSSGDDWAIGTLVNGVHDGSNNKRITDKTYIPVFKGCAVTVLPLQYVIHYYDADKNYISDTGWTAEGTKTTITNDAVYIRICCRVNNAYVFTEDDLVTYADCIKVEYPVNYCLQYLRDNQIDKNQYKAELFLEIIQNSFNSAFHTGASSWETKCATYSQLFNDSEHIESFMFFTDPHFFTRVDSVWQERMPEFITEMQKYYNSTPTTFCLCGGDWLTASDSNETALFRLGYIYGFMNAMFDNYYPMFGNHDDNYQGSTTDGGTPATATPLNKQILVNLWFRKFGKAYYTFNGTNTKFYVFDSGNDWNINMSDYRWEQIDWFATSLLSDASERIAVATHIAYNSVADYESDTLFPMTDYIGQVIEAYNSRASITLNSKTYDFSAVTGSIKFIIAGHLHADGLKTIYGVPLILTINTQALTTEPSFDLIYVDYDNNQIDLVRVGSGSNRTVQM